MKKNGYFFFPRVMSSKKIKNKTIKRKRNTQMVEVAGDHKKAKNENGIPKIKVKITKATRFVSISFKSITIGIITDKVSKVIKIL